jgi:hypothetical protein
LPAHHRQIGCECKHADLVLVDLFDTERRRPAADIHLPSITWVNVVTISLVNGSVAAARLNRNPPQRPA